jgi:putative hydrolase of the HAD superfamily
MAIVTNTPWGAPANLWREEVARLGLADYMDRVVCCTDAGWRKPARQVFEFTLEKLQVSAQECVFVGDRPDWDVAGARAMGMDAILIDRSGTIEDSGEKPIRNLGELEERL